MANWADSSANGWEQLDCFSPTDQTETAAGRSALMVPIRFEMPDAARIVDL